jgi:hypothetical protein
MMETLCLRNEEKRYIVSFRNKILFVTHNYKFARRMERGVAYLLRRMGDESTRKY